MPVVYLDILLAVNWFVDTLLLSATARTLRLTPKWFRVVLGGFTGAVLGCVLFLLELPTIAVLTLHIVLAAAMVLVSFPLSGLRAACSRVIVLYCLCGLFSGLITALARVTGSELLLGHNCIVYFDISPLTLAILACTVYAVMRLFEYTTRKRVPINHAFELRIADENGISICRALYDTGLHIAEPFSGRPAVIVERAAVETCVTADIYQALGCMVVTAASQATRRVRMIPYHAVGTEGALAAFVPKKLEVYSSDGTVRDITGTYVAVTDGIMRDGYEALIGSDSVGKGG